MDALSVAASGMRAAQVRMGAVAHNVANLHTEAFRPLRVQQSALESGGVATRVQAAETAVPPDFLREYLAQFEPPIQFEASARVFAAASEMTGTLIDVLA